MFPATAPASRSARRRGPTACFSATARAIRRSLSYAIDNAKALVDADVPVFGICLGHQVLSLAMGGETYKLKFGHRGANHPVKELETGKVEITSQNHGFAVDPESLPRDVRGDARQPLRRHCRRAAPHEQPVFCVQYHPEASPGPHDADYLFRQFVDEMERARLTMPKRTDIKRDARHRLRPDRHRAGVRVRLLGHAGVQGAAGRGARGRSRQQQPGDDHDRSGDRRPHLRRAADRRDARRRSSTRERPDAILPTVGGQTALNLAVRARRAGHARRSTASS